jgi:hypothetical protein
LLVHGCEIPTLCHEFLSILLVDTTSLEALEVALDFQLFRNALDLFFHIVGGDPQPISQ